MNDTIASLLPLPNLSMLVLLALTRGDAHGWAIIRQIRELEGTARTPSSGSLYIAMVRLQEKGLIEETAPPEGTTDDDERRRYYRLTPFGRSVLDAELARLARLVEAGREWSAAEGGA